PDDLFEAVSEADADNGIAWLDPAPFENTYRIAVKNDFAESNGLETMSDAAKFISDNEDQGKVCAASDFVNRDDGLPGLEEAYVGVFDEVVELDLNDVYPQVGKKCQVGEAFCPVARMRASDMTVGEDDNEFVVQYLGPMTVGLEALADDPE